MSVFALLSQDTLGAVNALAEERGWTDTMTLRVAGPGQGSDLLEEAARVPAELLLLDVGAGPGLGQAVLRYRLARPETRIVLLAPGRKPGDAEVAAIVAAGVYDVVEDLADLGSVIDFPRGIAGASRWLGAKPDVAGAAAPTERRARRAWWERRRGARVKVDADPLTGLPGREAGTRRLAAALSAGGAAAVFVDLDGFKAINDTRGHAEGDRVLHKAARAMRRAVRGEDLLCRWGGDEFVAVLPGADLITAQDVAERLREAVAGIIGASVGVAVSRPGDGPEDLIDRADRAMYEDKRARKATQDAADDPWPVFRPSELPPVPTLTRREVTTDWVRVARGGMAVIGATVSLVRLAVWLGALAFLGLLGLRLLAMWNEMSIIWRGMLR